MITLQVSLDSRAKSRLNHKILSVQLLLRHKEGVPQKLKDPATGTGQSYGFIGSLDVPSCTSNTYSSQEPKRGRWFLCD
jgi:hypothetical protein